jgi:hypothetical protein
MLIQVIQYLVPKAECAIYGEPTTADEYVEQVTWLDDRPQPTWADIEAARPAAEVAQANATARINRHQAFQAEADPLYFAWQRGEATEEDWLAKCAEIRARYPYVEATQ